MSIIDLTSIGELVIGHIITVKRAIKGKVCNVKSSVYSARGKKEIERKEWQFRMR